jgi:hypothetical protein
MRPARRLLQLSFLTLIDTGGQATTVASVLYITAVHDMHEAGSAIGTGL